MVFKCSYCPREFPSDYRKNEHEMVHLGERVSCQLCGKTYSNHSNLGRHHRAEHEVPDNSSRTQPLDRAHSTRSVAVQTVVSSPSGYLNCGECSAPFGYDESEAYNQHVAQCVSQGRVMTRNKK